MARIHLVFSCVFALLLLPVAPVAAVDSTGSMGPVVALRDNSSDSDTYSSSRGSVHIEVGGQFDEYFWGGAKCSAFDLSDAEVALLQQALGNPRILVRPFYKVQGNSECLVGFRLVRRDWGGLF